MQIAKNIKRLREEKGFIDGMLTKSNFQTFFEQNIQTAK